MLESGRPISELAALLEPFPQRLVNVHVERKLPFEDVPEVQKALVSAEKALGNRGRVLLRYSGTEAVARVMVEGEDPERVQRLAEDLAQVLEDHLR
jgi:phosphoglucosamine mutase